MPILRDFGLHPFWDSTNVFDFLCGSPFGRDHFDYFDFRPHDATYEDVFDGFVFYRPLSEHRLVSGIPGMFDDGFEAEAKRRLAVTGRTVDDEDFAAIVAASSEPLIEKYEDLERYEVMIGRWLEGEAATEDADSGPRN